MSANGNNRFNTGHGVSGVFNCGNCGRRTRHSGQASESMCRQCDEYTAIENGIVNGGFGDSPEEQAEAEARIEKLMSEVRAKGGNI